MPLLAWDDAFLVEVAVIDYQHRRLVALINELDEALVARNSRAVLRETFAELENYIVSHFSTEERVFEEFHDPGLAEHRAEHEKFTRQIGVLREKFLASEDVAHQVMQYLADWLVDHILKKDKESLERIRAAGHLPKQQVEAT